ncbi:hypothetical protein TRP8649_02302 [Pelagimonas phthalicica]|uniref:Uncharacterized protein n=1 Tax=Pelagimonas phthalicica TaxID=1037362 RepID=A0A238JDF7_9RHOB|nr:hypothetical protein [Pelagimonas phthalicica]TDS91140.1 hypothetical protein CLV87_2304 [Pelagimonas phthalicica]SMX28187.1 hypothetical protein TRP8649_02302 [Pelagimonas phthalicica]
MTYNFYGITEAELFRLITAYSAIKNPSIRAEFLRTVEAWAMDQWDASGSEVP